MKKNMIVKEQFDKQATNFNNWPVTQNEKNHQSLFKFFGLQANHMLLDFACGTGAFAIYAAQRMEAVQGVDISEGMIKIAVESAKRHNLDNISFLCCDVEKVPFESEDFDCVASKSAFHHIKNYQAVFREMTRCCKKEGRVCLQDIISYDDKKLDSFFEELECKIDISHHQTLSKQEIINVYKQNGVEITYLFHSVSELNFLDYLNHAVQTPDNKKEICNILEAGLKDEQISKCFVTKNGSLFWKRNVFTIVGQKQ